MIFISFYFIVNPIKSFPYSNNPPLSTTQPWELLKTSWKFSMIFLWEYSSKDVWNIQLVKVAIWKHFVEVILHLPSYCTHWQFVKNLIFLKVLALSDVNHTQTLLSFFEKSDNEMRIFQFKNDSSYTQAISKAIIRNRSWCGRISSSRIPHLYKFIFVKKVKLHINSMKIK